MDETYIEDFTKRLSILQKNSELRKIYGNNIDITEIKEEQISSDEPVLNTTDPIKLDIINILTQPTNERLMILDLEGNLFKLDYGLQVNHKEQGMLVLELSFLIIANNEIIYEYSTLVKPDKQFYDDITYRHIKYAMKNINGLRFETCNKYGKHITEAYNKFLEYQKYCKYILVKGSSMEQAFINKKILLQSNLYTTILNKIVINIEQYGVIKIDKCNLCKKHSNCGYHVQLKEHIIHCSLGDINCYYEQLKRIL